MRNVDREPGLEFTDSGIEHIAGWLDRRSDVQAWGLVLGSIALVAALDFSTWIFELCIATLYILPVCLAAWMFRTSAAIGTTILVTFIAFLKYPLLHTGPSVLTTVYNGTSRALAFALLTAIMLAFRRSHDRARLAASRDRMTGALNKQTFHERTLGLLDTAFVAGRTVLLLYLDLDGFKAVNDQHGHHIGDEVLQSFVAGASRALRTEDCFGRLGGDEFGVALVANSGEEAFERAESLHRHFTSALASSGHSVTCSMGALIVPAGGRFSCAELMKAADQLMYASKHGGKNAVTVATAIARDVGAGLPAPRASGHRGVTGTISSVSDQSRLRDRSGKPIPVAWLSGSLVSPRELT